MLEAAQMYCSRKHITSTTAYITISRIARLSWTEGNFDRDHDRHNPPFRYTISIDAGQKMRLLIADIGESLLVPHICPALSTLA